MILGLPAALWVPGFQKCRCSIWSITRHSDWPSVRDQTLPTVCSFAWDRWAWFSYRALFLAQSLVYSGVVWITC